MGNGPSREKNRQKTDELRDFVFAFFLYAYIVYAPEARLPVLCSARTPRPVRINFRFGVVLRVLVRWKMGLATRKPAKST